MIGQREYWQFTCGKCGSSYRYYEYPNPWCCINCGSKGAHVERGFD